MLEKEPGFAEGRKALRAEQFKKAGTGGGGFFKKMMSGAGSSPQIAKAKMVLGKNPTEAMVIAEQVLSSDPHSSAAHRIIVDAAKALEMPNTAVFELETMAKNSPKDKALVIEYAEMVAGPAPVPPPPRRSSATSSAPPATTRTCCRPKKICPRITP